MRKKQANMHLDQRHQLMLENAFYMVSLYILLGPHPQATRKRMFLPLVNAKNRSATHLKELSEK